VRPLATLAQALGDLIPENKKAVEGIGEFVRSQFKRSVRHLC